MFIGQSVTGSMGQNVVQGSISHATPRYPNRGLRLRKRSMITDNIVAIVSLRVPAQLPLITSFTMLLTRYLLPEIELSLNVI